MRDKAEEFEARYVASMFSGDVDALVELCRLPLPVFFPDGIKVDATYSDIFEGVTYVVDRMKSLGIVRAVSNIQTVERRGDSDAIAYLVETHMLDRFDAPVRTAIAKRFLEKDGAGYRMTMLDVKQPAIGILNGKRKLRVIH